MTMTFATGFFVPGLLPRLFAASSLLLLAACSTGHLPEAGASREIDWVAASTAQGSSAKWEHRSFPGKKSTLYQTTRAGGRSAPLPRAAPLVEPSVAIVSMFPPVPTSR